MATRDKKILNKFKSFLDNAEKTVGHKIDATTGGKSANHDVLKRKIKEGKGALDIGTKGNNLDREKKKKIAKLALRQGLRVGFEGDHLHVDDNPDIKTSTEKPLQHKTFVRKSGSPSLEKEVLEDHKKEIGARGSYLYGAPKEPVQEQAIFGTDPVQTVKAIRKKREAREASSDPNRNAPLDLTDPSEDDAMSGIDRIIQNTGASSDVARDPDSVQDDVSIEVKKKEGEKLIKERPAAVKEIIKQVGEQQGADPKDIDGAIKNVDNISANRDKPSGNSISSQFTNALTFFLPSILGGLIGSIDSTEGALAGAETAQGLYGQFLDRGDKERTLDMQEQSLDLKKGKGATEQRRLAIAEANLGLRGDTLEMNREAEARRNKQLDLNVQKFGLSKEQAGQLSGKQVDQLKDMNNVEFSIDRINELRKEVNTGPLAGRVQSLAQWADLAPESFNRMKTQTASTLSNYVKSISGAQVAEAEAVRLQAVIPSVNDAPGVFKAKLDEFKKIVRMNKKAFAQAIATGQPLRANAIKGLLSAEQKFKQKAPARVSRSSYEEAIKNAKSIEEIEQIKQQYGAR